MIIQNKIQIFIEFNKLKRGRFFFAVYSASLLQKALNNPYHDKQQQFYIYYYIGPSGYTLSKLKINK